MFDFNYQLKILPDKPGVYLMKNFLGEIIYVGKAKKLKNRVRQYFQKSKNHSVKVKAMVKNISEFEYIVTDSEMEALILECNLIKKYSPKYNIDLKDDKFYPFIKITVNEDFPRIFITRNFVKDGSRYFGPYTNVTAVYETMNLIKKTFPIRNCKMNIIDGKTNIRPCLNYYIKKCNGPCGQFISKEDYGKMVSSIIDILSGTDRSVVLKLKKDMEELSLNLEFEKAAELRDKIISINTLVEKQKIFKTTDEDEDFIDMYSDEKDACVQIFFLRNGKIMGREHSVIENIKYESKKNIISQFLVNFYSGTARIAKTVYIPEVEDKNTLEEFLSVKRGSKVSIKIPQKGDKKKMLNMVKSNAEIMLTQFKEKIIRDKRENEIEILELKELLGLDHIPSRIEAYDISNIQGVDSVGTMVVFEKGKAKNNDYRRFKIKSVKGANDYKSMEEILNRRFKRGLQEIKEIQNKSIELSKGKFCNFPDLIIMDGGKGQINVALEVLSRLGINIDVCGLVKDDKHQTRGIIYNNEEYMISKTSNLMQMMRRIQDEVHRFAITYHRTLRDKRILHSILDEIPNIGDKRRKALLMYFGGIENIKGATRQELEKIKELDKKSIESVLAYFNNRE